MQDGDRLPQCGVVPVSQIFQGQLNLDVRSYPTAFETSALSRKYIVFADLKFGAIPQAVIDAGEQATAGLPPNHGRTSILLHACCKELSSAGRAFVHQDYERPAVRTLAQVPHIEVRWYAKHAK